MHELLDLIIKLKFFSVLARLHGRLRLVQQILGAIFLVEKTLEVINLFEYLECNQIDKGRRKPQLIDRQLREIKGVVLLTENVPLHRIQILNISFSYLQMQVANTFLLIEFEAERLMALKGFLYLQQHILLQILRKF